jgi:tRNA dimethylallyltransferase
MERKRDIGLSKTIASKKILPVIIGQTASGKTATSIELSKLLDIEIISADSRQIYKYLDIGTAKPSVEELKTVQHHFIDNVLPDEYYSAGMFGRQASEKIELIYNAGKLPIVVGGSGLYIKALCEGFFEETENIPTNEIRNELTNKFENEGIDVLYEELKRIDKISADLYCDKNPRRIIRALEFFNERGYPISQAKEKFAGSRNFEPIYFGVKFDREVIYNRINQRTEQMWAKGLADEVKYILSLGYSPDLNSLNTVGYKEVIQYLNGIISGKDAIELIKKNTRNYAKRQMTWFRKMKDIVWIEGDSISISNYILNYFKNQIVKS